MVSPLPMQITVRLLVMVVQSSEPQTEEQPGLHNQAEQHPDLYGVSFTDANNGTAVGDYGTILRTTNGGTTWTSQSSGTTNYLYECLLY